MLTCPMCKKKLRGVETECGNCRTDVSLLVAYVNNLRDGLVAAEKHTKAGELAEAVWAYLAVLEVDPENPVAREQVGKVATAVRQFDEVAPGQRWMKKLRKGGWFRAWLSGDDGESAGYLSYLMWFVIFSSLLLVGYFIGVYTSAPTMSKVDPNEEQTEKGPRPPVEEVSGMKAGKKDPPGLRSK